MLREPHSRAELISSFPRSAVWLKATREESQAKLRNRSVSAATSSLVPDLILLSDLTRWPDPGVRRVGGFCLVSSQFSLLLQLVRTWTGELMRVVAANMPRIWPLSRIYHLGEPLAIIGSPIISLPNSLR